MGASMVENDILETIIENVKAEFLSSEVTSKLTQIWNELWDGDEIERRKEILAKECGKEISDVIMTVLDKETETRDNYIGRIEKLLKEMKDLQSSLGITIPYDEVASLPLHNMAFNLNKKADRYRLIREERLAKLKELLETEAYLCDMLGTVQTSSCSSIPTEQELEQLSNTIDSMEREKVDRTFTFLEKRKLICDLYKELGIQPVLKFEKEVVDELSIAEFRVTNENMADLDKLLRNLTEQLEEAKQTVAELREKLVMLWKYLDEPETYSNNFLGNLCGHTTAVISEMKKELARCEAVKRTNIAKIVGRIRTLLVEEWDRCMISQEQRDAFRPFRIDYFTEDLCELHEMEIERLKNYYRDNEHIFNLYGKHQRLFEKLLELEDRGKNTNRYYNRGGKLLQEERERKMITKELPQVEEDLRFLLARHELDHSGPFTVHGEPLTQRLDDQWANHFDQKTIEKLARKGGSEKKKQTPLGKRLFPTPGSAAVANKVSRLNSEKAVSSTTKCTPGVTLRPAQRRILTRSKSDEPDTTFMVEPTYDDFQNELQAKVESSDGGRKATRSTAVTPVSHMTQMTQTRVLRERNTPSTPRKLPYLTPKKPATPAWSANVPKTPMTFPRSSRRRSGLQRSPSVAVLSRLTPARSRLPIII